MGLDLSWFTYGDYTARGDRRQVTHVGLDLSWFTMATTLLVATAAALARMPSILGRSALTRYLAETSTPDVAVTWVEDASGAALQLRLWETIAAAAAAASSGSSPTLLALPSVTPAYAMSLIELPSDSTAGVRLTTLPPSSPVPGILVEPVPANDGGGATDGSSTDAATRLDADAVLDRSRAWVQRTLAPGPLNFCPYTASAALAGVGLEVLGVRPAPISYGVCEGAALPEVLVSFWRLVNGAMLKPGEAGSSSILLMAPRWDGR